MKKLIVGLFFVGLTANAVDVIQEPTQQGGMPHVKLASGKAVPLYSVMTTDGSGNLIPISSGGGSVTQGTTPWVVDGSAVTQPVSAASLPLPTGAATSARQDTGNTSLSSIDGKLNSLGQKTMANSTPVVIASDQDPVKTSAQGKTKVALVRNVYSSTNVTTAAYVELIASTSDVVTRLHVFDSSGQSLVIAVGGAGSEVDQFYIPPGGVDPIDLSIPASSRVSIKAVSGTASTGELLITLLK